MSNPTLKLGTKGDLSTKIYRDNADNNKTIFTNNSIDILKLSGTGGQDTVDITGNVNVSSSYDVNGTQVLNETTLSSSVVNSNITSNTGNLTNTGTLNLTTGNDFQINSASVLNANTLGSAIVNSSLTSLGNLTSLIIDGDLTVNGTTTTFNTENIVVDDPLMKLANGNNADTLDIGHFGLYNDGTTKFTGIFRDATDGVYKLFDGLTVEPTNVVDTLDGSYSNASLLINNLDASSATIVGDFTVDTTTLHVDSTNNMVGIGNINPAYDLDINGDLNLTGIIYQNGVTVDATAWTSSGNNVYNTNIGNIGIGITNPIVPLDVVGDINTSTDYNILGTQVLSANTLGTGVVNSSLTSVGDLTDLTVVGDYGSVSGNVILTGGSLATVNGVIFTTNGDITATNGRVIAGSDMTAGLFKIGGNSVLNATTLGSGVVNSSLQNANLTSNTGNLTNTGTLNLTTGNDFQINSSSVLNATTLGSAVVNSSLTNVGILTALNISGNLTVTGDTVFNGDTDNQADETSSHALKISTETSGQTLMIGYDGDDDMSYINSGKTGANTSLTLQTRGGNVGIGITNPSFILDVLGDINTSTDYNILGTQVLSSNTLGTGVVNSSLTSNTGNLTNTGTLNLTTGNDFQINSSSVLNATTLGSAVVNSSLTSLGTITSLTADSITSNGDIDIAQDQDITYRNDSTKFYPRRHRVQISGGSSTSVLTLSDFGLGQAQHVNNAGLYFIQIQRNDGDYAHTTNPYWSGYIMMSDFAGGKAQLISTIGSGDFTSIVLNGGAKTATFTWTVTAPTMSASYHLMS